jgi:putative hydrolase of the HAD superfamily
MTIRFLLFDLDETLYPRDAGVMQEIGRLIRRYIVQEYGTTWEEADRMARSYHQQYGTSMRGLLLNNNLDVDRFLAYVHDLPPDLLRPNLELDALLAGLPGEKVIFTNADRPHAERVLERLGIRRHFSRIVDVVAVGYVPKPNLEAYTACLRLLDANPQECVLIEDTGRNLDPAKQLGMITVLVDGDPTDPADHKIPTILELGPVVEAIFQRQVDW